VNVEELRGQVNDDLLPYKRIKELHVIDALPVSGAGKILKRELRDRLAGISAGTRAVTP
jgi:long-chain acyl-CoA synthetase